MATTTRHAVAVGATMGAAIAAAPITTTPLMVAVVALITTAPTVVVAAPINISMGIAEPGLPVYEFI